MNVTILTPIRDAAHLVDAYRERVESLTHPYADLRVLLVEGDSADNTAARCWEWAAQDGRVTVVTCNTGKPRYASIVNADRFALLAQVFNAGLDAVDLDWSTHVLMLPCDIRYGPDLLARLLAHAVDVVSPFVWQGDIFYDTWAFGRGGHQFSNFTRAHAAQHLGTELFKMDTVGGTCLLRAAVLRAGCRYTPSAVDRGLCEQARAHGFGIWADPTTHVEHGG